MVHFTRVTVYPTPQMSHHSLTPRLAVWPSRPKFSLSMDAIHHGTIRPKVALSTHSLSGDWT